MIPYGSLVVYVNSKDRHYVKRLEEGQDWHSNDGTLAASEVAKANYGDIIYTASGNPIRIREATLYDRLLGLKRQTQIIYPKDIAQICLRLGAGPGRVICEAGCGSGALTMALSWFCGPTGKVVSHEARPEFAKLARRNLDWAGFGENVEIVEKNVEGGFAVDNADAVFLDMREPWLCVDSLLQALKPGGMAGFLLPTANQVEKLLLALEKAHFEDVEVGELLLRSWKPLPDRLRPHDRMAAHTGFLVFARQGVKMPFPESPGTRERKQEAARLSRLAGKNDISQND